MTKAQKSGASERRSEVSRVPTPYADITQIRFWGLRLTALSAPRGRSPVVFSCLSSVLGRLLDRLDVHDLGFRGRNEPGHDEDRE